MGRLAGKVAIVTGATGGIGASCAQLFAAEGATVYACDLLDPLNLAGPTGIRHRRMDVSQEADWRALINEVAADCGRLDILVNNAGDRRPQVDR
jgi:3alpha(or 20beta)-hydroxysteroid dehydrogenase